MKFLMSQVRVLGNQYTYVLSTPTSTLSDTIEADDLVDAYKKVLGVLDRINELDSDQHDYKFEIESIELKQWELK